MIEVRDLVARLAAAEDRLPGTRFVAPRVARGRVRTRIEGLVHTFLVRPVDYEGWAVLRPRNTRLALVEAPASLAQVEGYLHLLRPMRVRLAFPLRNRTWLAYPENEGDAVQRGAPAAPLAVHLVEGQAFEAAVACSDGSAWWFAGLDRRSDPRHADRLRQSLREDLEPDRLAWSGLTPEMRTVYRLSWSRRRPPDPKFRLERALQMGGARLQAFQDRGDYWQVEWQTADGGWHASAIAKHDLTVLSAGICLAGHDRQFDLQSLVGVVEGR